MANRHTLHIKHLEDFTSYVQKMGYEIQEPKGIYEVLRASKNKDTIILYRKDSAKQHLTVCDKDIRVVISFLHQAGKERE